jgi:NADH:ubiquinone oxidoreductase subunit 6 (subunit J)
MAQVIFFFAAIVALAGAGGTVLLRNPFYSVLALVCHLLGLAALFLLLRAEFVAAAQVIVYAGAVMVLYVFVVAYVGGSETAQLRPPVGRGQRTLALAFALALFAELIIASVGSGLQALDTEGAGYRPGFGTPSQIGELLLTRFLLPFEVASFLLLIAAVGAVTLARRRGGVEGEEPEHVLRTLAATTPRPLATGTMAEGGGLTRPTSGEHGAPGEGPEPVGTGAPEAGW